MTVPIDSEQNQGSEAEPARRSSLWRILKCLTLLACLPTLLAFGARWHWFLDLFTHFRVYYACPLLLAATVFLWGKKKRWSVLSLLVASFNLLLILPIYLTAVLPADMTTGNGPKTVDQTYRGYLANVYTDNRQFERLLTSVSTHNPDFLLLMEVDDRWMKALKPLDETYPHQAVASRDDNFGIAFYSQLLIDNWKVVNWGDSGVPTLIVNMQLAGQPVTIVGLHTLPPANGEYSRIRNLQLEELTNFVNNSSQPVIVMGDFNITSWSPYFADLINQTNLHDSRHGFGIQPSWNGGKRALAIPIDHVLVPDEVTVTDRKVLEDIGSDHWPVRIDFNFAPKE